MKHAALNTRFATAAGLGDAFCTAALFTGFALLERRLPDVGVTRVGTPNAASD
jgi:hypothetical protein